MSVLKIEVMFGCNSADVVEQKGKWPCSECTQERKNLALTQRSFVHKFGKLIHK